MTLQDEVDRLIKEAMALEAEALVRRQAAAKIRAAIDELSGLRVERAERTLPATDMIDDRDLEQRARHALATTRRTHPALEYFYAKNKTLSDVSREIRETRSRVSSWFALPPHNRPIPERYVSYFKQMYGVPEKCWARVRRAKSDE